MRRRHAGARDGRTPFAWACNAPPARTASGPRAGAARTRGWPASPTRGTRTQAPSKPRRVRRSARATSRQPVWAQGAPARETAGRRSRLRSLERAGQISLRDWTAGLASVDVAWNSRPSPPPSMPRADRSRLLPPALAPSGANSIRPARRRCARALTRVNASGRRSRGSSSAFSTIRLRTSSPSPAASPGRCRRSRLHASKRFEDRTQHRAHRFNGHRLRRGDVAVDHSWRQQAASNDAIRSRSASALTPCPTSTGSGTATFPAQVMKRRCRTRALQHRRRGPRVRLVNAAIVGFGRRLAHREPQAEEAGSDLFERGGDRHVLQEIVVQDFAQLRIAAAGRAPQDGPDLVVTSGDSRHARSTPLPASPVARTAGSSPARAFLAGIHSVATVA